jgi:hypothetical protein
MKFEEKEVIFVEGLEVLPTRSPEVHLITVGGTQ